MAQGSLFPASLGIAGTLNRSRLRHLVGQEPSFFGRVGNKPRRAGLPMFLFCNKKKGFPSPFDRDDLQYIPST
jgi:hypothetical protein